MLKLRIHLPTLPKVTLSHSTLFQNLCRFVCCLCLPLGYLTAYGNVILFPELKLERLVCQTLGVSRENLSKKLLQDELKSLDASSLEIRDLTGLEFATNLETLVLRDNLIDDLKPISNLAHLRKLDLSGNRIRNLSQLVPLSGSKMRKEVVDLQLSLEGRKTSRSKKTDIMQELSALVERLKMGPWALREVNLSNNRLLGLTGIEHFTDLVFLNVSKNALIDLEGLNQLKSLITLYAEQNQLGRIETYVDENKNKRYDFGEPVNDQSGNGKRDTDPLVEIQSLPNLSNLYLHDNLIVSIDSIKDIPKLSVLFASNNKISDISTLSRFKNLTRLSLSDNKICSLAGIGDLINLKYLYLVENRISDLRPLRGMSGLIELHLQRNQLFDVRPIETLSNLEVLSLGYNLIYSSQFAQPLKKVRHLSIAHNCLSNNESSHSKTLQIIKSRGGRLYTTSQRARIPEVESLLGFLSGYPAANQKLGDYLSSHGYDNFMDYIEDLSISDDEKAASFLIWEQTLKKGLNLNDLAFIK